MEERQQISYGKLINRDSYQRTHFIPDKVRTHLKEKPYYLFIYVPADEIIKVSIFACENSNVKKILISLKEFAPDLVKGISEVLKNFKLGEGTIHTTGLCFESTDCYYETYIDYSVIKNKAVSLEKIKKEFLKVNRVQKVEILDIPIAE